MGASNNDKLNTLEPQLLAAGKSHYDKGSLETDDKFGKIGR